MEIFETVEGNRIMVRIADMIVVQSLPSGDSVRVEMSSGSLHNIKMPFATFKDLVQKYVR